MMFPLSSSMISKVLLLVKQICPRTPQVYNLRTSIPIFLQSSTLKAIERIRNALATANDAFVLVITKGAFVTDTGEGGGAHIGVTYRAFSVAFVAEAADGYTSLFAAHY
jgi:hypothetical protein